MADETEFTLPTPDPALRRLDFLVGQWRLTGTIEDGPAGPGGELSGEETFEWMEGGFFLVHRWQGTMTMGDNVMVDSGYEFYDYDPATQTYRSHFFNNFGPYDEKDSKYVGGFNGDGLVLTGPARITRRPAGDGVVAYDGDLPDGSGGWTPWMHARLIRIEPGSAA